MNCQEVREQLIDLLYGELDDAQQRQVMAHLDGCDACRGELRRLQRARSALAVFRAGEPTTMSVLKGELFGTERTEPAGRARFRVGHWLAAGAGVAAAVLLGWAAWMLQGTKMLPTAAAEQTGPVEIKRVALSLTILSAPPGSEGQYPQPRPMAAQGAEYQSEQMDYQVTVNGGQALGRGGWQGLALVRDQRLAANLRKGANEVRFKGVPAGILPDTVRLRSLDFADGLTIMEQNYQYDLASAAAVLKKHVDKQITVSVKDLPAVTGELLSYDHRNLVVRPKGEGPRSVSREKVRAIAFEKLPEGLLTTPTLVWQLNNKADRKQQFEVAYMTRGLAWRADYVLKLRPAVRPAGAGAAKPQAAGTQGAEGAKPQAAIPDIMDGADLVGYATVTNLSGVTYENAQLKLMAGDVNLIQDEGTVIHRYKQAQEQLANRLAEAREQFEEKSFFEYHLYTLGRPTTIRDAETKQIELVTGEGIKLKRGYVYDPSVNRTAARVVSEFRNSEENGLGKPMPKGVVRLYAPDPEGAQTYVSQTSIDHTPVNEKVRLPWGFAFDIACTAKTTGSRTAGDEHAETREYELRNHKDYGVTVTVIFRVPRTTYEGECNIPWHVREVGVVEADVPLAPGATVKVTFSYKANNKTGGGLKSPYDK